jgi:hypothetical protein
MMRSSGAEMAARDRNGVDQFVAQFVGELAQLRLVELLQVGRMRNGIEQRSLGHQDSRPRRKSGSSQSSGTAL